MSPTEKQLNFIKKIENCGIAICTDKSTKQSCWKFINDNKDKYSSYIKDINSDWCDDEYFWDTPLSQWGNG